MHAFWLEENSDEDLEFVWMKTSFLFNSGFYNAFLFSLFFPLLDYSWRKPTCFCFVSTPVQSVPYSALELSAESGNTTRPRGEADACMLLSQPDICQSFSISPASASLTLYLALQLHPQKIFSSKQNKTNKNITTTNTTTVTHICTSFQAFGVQFHWFQG